VLAMEEMIKNDGTKAIALRIRGPKEGIERTSTHKTVKQLFAHLLFILPLIRQG